jgi:tyrosyl-tRNA synthetase
VPAITPEERCIILKSIAEECINEGELKQLLQKKPNPICYDGFEPSGSMHIAQVRLDTFLYLICSPSIQIESTLFSFDF